MESQITLSDILKDITKSLGVQDINEEVLSILEQRKIDKINIPKGLSDTIYEVIQSNKIDIGQFENKLKNDETRELFNELKKKLGKLQIFALIKKIKELKLCDGELVNDFLIKFKNNITASNKILQAGGTYKSNKYLKHILKFIKLSYNL
jgi:hypothetical protein